MLLPFLPVGGHFPLSARSQPQQLVLWSLMLLSFLRPWGLCISVALAGILLPCSSPGQILLIFQVSANTASLLWPFQPPSLKQCLNPSPKDSTIHSPIFLSCFFQLFYPLIYSYFFFVYLPIVVLLSHICPMRTETFFGLFSLSCAPTTQHNRHCISILWTNEWLSEWLSPLGSSRRSTCSYSIEALSNGFT